MKIIIGIDVDFEGYNPFDKHTCSFEKNSFEKNIFALAKYLKKNYFPAIFFLHTSPYIRKNYSNIFFTDKYYIDFWKSLESEKFEIGFHPHEESENGKYYFYYMSNYMETIFQKNLNLLSKNGLKINSIRTGFFSFNEWLIPICEKYKINFSFDNMAAYQPLTSTHFDNAPLYPYFYDYEDKEREGDSKVYSIPLGCGYNYNLWNGLIPECNDFSHIKKLWDLILAREDEKYWCCNILIHSYNFLKHKRNIIKSLEYIANKGEFILTDYVRKKINL